MGDAIPFRTFKIPNIVETDFFSSTNTNNEEFCKRDLARSGLVPDDVAAYSHPMMRLAAYAKAGYGIPYYDLDGNPLVNDKKELIMYRIRVELPEFSRESRYLQPAKDALAKNNLPPYIPYVPPSIHDITSDTLICCEGEKKTAAVLKFLKKPAFGIGGCQMWRDPAGTGNVHPWIQELITKRCVSTVIIIPDGDVHRYDISSAYGTYARALISLGVSVKIVSLSNAADKVDDLIVAGKFDLDTTELIDPNDLVQSPESLAKRYSLAFRLDSKGRTSVLQHTANVMRLMEEHPAFPSIWRNEDTGKVMLGEAAAIPDLTEVELANYLQYNLGFDKITHRHVYTCIQALAKRNSRSPFLDRVRSYTWDRVPRLDTWLSRMWGVVDTEYAREVASKWLISSCARLDKPGTKLDWMMIVVGEQGIGKTSMPAILFSGLTTVLYGEHNHKDLHMLLHSALCTCFDELDSFGKRETSNLKAMITSNEDVFRPPYGASIEVFPRRFILYGCGNRYEFLQHDPSGYRRYAVIEAKQKLDFKALEAERDQLWAEAWWRYTNEPIEFYNISAANAEAQKYVIANPVEDYIINWIDTQRVSKHAATCHEGTVFFSMAALLIGIGLDRDIKNSSTTREIAAILHQIGARQFSGTNPCTKQRGRFYRMD